MSFYIKVITQAKLFIPLGCIACENIIKISKNYNNQVKNKNASSNYLPTVKNYEKRWNPSKHCGPFIQITYAERAFA